MHQPVRVVVLKAPQTFGPHLHIGQTALAVAQHHIGRRADLLPAHQRQRGSHIGLFQHQPFDGVVGQAGLPLEVVESVAKVGHPRSFIPV